MTDYRDPAPMHFPPPAREFRGEGEPLYPEKWPELVKKDEDAENSK